MLLATGRRPLVLAELLDRLVGERQIDQVLVFRRLALRDIADLGPSARAVKLTRFGPRPVLASQMHFSTMKSSALLTTSFGSLVYLTMIGTTLARSV